MTRPKLTERPAPAASCTSPSRCWRTSISSARCSPPFGRSATSRPSIWYRAGASGLHRSSGDTRLPLRVRYRQAGARSRNRDVGPPGADTDCVRLDPQARGDRGADMSPARTSGRPAHRRSRLRRASIEAGSVILGVILLIWSLTPIYNMFLIALDPEEGEIEFTGNLWPPEPSLDGFRDVVTQEARYLEDFWHQFGNSIYIGLLTMLLTVLIGSLASFAVSRMRLTKGSLLTKAALFTYAIPASFLIVPYYRIMHLYGLSDNLWAVIAAQVSFATPFAILIMQLYR